MTNIQAILDSLDFQPTCTIGKEAGYGHGRITPCARPAAWTVTYHDCTPTDTTPKTGMWCDHHLKLFRLSIDTQINDNPHPIGCRTCHKIFQMNIDFVWGELPLTARSQP